VVSACVLLKKALNFRVRPSGSTFNQFVPDIYNQDVKQFLPKFSGQNIEAFLWISVE
jgi:hypothetical protein